MKKVFFALMALLFLAACSGNADRKDDSSADEQIEAMNKELDQIESATDEMKSEAEELSAAADSLLNNL